MAAPRGNRNAAKAKVWTAAIERALDRRKPADERIKAIDELADKFLDVCASGDLVALRELGDRLEGKAAQDVNVSGEVHQTHTHIAVSEVAQRLQQLLGRDEDSGVPATLPH